MCRAPLLLIFLAANLPNLGRADTLSLGATDLKNISVTRVDASRVYYKSGSSESSAELSAVTRLALDDEPALGSAEIAAATNNADLAAENYLRALRGTQKPWLRAYIAPRLASAATKARRFDLSTAGYILLLNTDPAVADGSKPVLTGTAVAPAPRPGDLAAAIDAVQSALTKTPSSVPLLKFLADLQTAQGDPAAALTTLTKAAALDPTVAPAAATARLAAANSALARGDASAALALLSQTPDAFTTPATQVEALYLLAYAKETEALAIHSTAALQDAAIAYLRVSAHFRQDLNATSRVESALTRAALILEELHQPAEAHALWRELSSSKDPEISAQAKQGLARTLG